MQEDGGHAQGNDRKMIDEKYFHYRLSFFRLCYDDDTGPAAASAAVAVDQRRRDRHVAKQVERICDDERQKYIK